MDFVSGCGCITANSNADARRVNYYYYCTSMFIQMNRSVHTGEVTQLPVPVCGRQLFRSSCPIQRLLDCTLSNTCNFFLICQCLLKFVHIKLCTFISSCLTYLLFHKKVLLSRNNSLGMEEGAVVLEIIRSERLTMTSRQCLLSVTHHTPVLDTRIMFLSWTAPFPGQSV